MMTNFQTDNFYTKKEVAKNLVAKTKQILNKYVTKLDNYFWVEPSAGTGAFLDYLGLQSVGYDIDPREKNKDYEIIKADWLDPLTWTDEWLYDYPLIIIGNPPFGKKSKMAIAFFNQSALLDNVKHIAFIVPFQFKKYSVQSKLNKNFKLIYQQDLEPNSFIFDDKDYKINCCFQIWTKSENKKIKDLRIKEKPPISHPDFTLFLYNNTEETYKYFNKEKYEWDFAVHRQGFYDYSHKIFNEGELNKKRQYIFIKIKDKKALKIFSILDFNLLSNKNTIIPGFGKADLVEEYSKLEKD